MRKRSASHGGGITSPDKTESFSGRRSTSHDVNLIEVVPESTKKRKKKKTKHVAVRFTEQKKIFLYGEGNPPVETDELIRGFISAPGLVGSDFDPLLREILVLVLFPKTPLPYPKDELLEHIRCAFSLTKEDFAEFIKKKQGFSQYSAHDDVEAMLYSLNHHPYYSKDSFQEIQDYKLWRTHRKNELNRLLAKIKSVGLDYSENDLISMSERSIDNSVTESENNQNMSTPRPLSGKEVHDVTFRPNFDDTEASSQDSDSGRLDPKVWADRAPKISILPPVSGNEASYSSIDSDSDVEPSNLFSETSPRRFGSSDDLNDALSSLDEITVKNDDGGVDNFEPSRYALLFNTLMSFDDSKLKERKKRVAAIISLIDKAHNVITTKYKLGQHVNMFEELPEINSPEYRNWLFKLSDISRWLLEQYAEHYGYTQLHCSFVFLQYAVSVFNIEADKLLMIYILLAEVLKQLRSSFYNTKEIVYFAQTMKTLNKESEEYIFNMFRHFSHDDLAALKMLLNILNIIYDLNELLDSTPTKSYMEYVEFAIFESVKNHYRDIKSETEEPKDPASGDPIGTNTSATVRLIQRNDNKLSAEQLIHACHSIEFTLENLKLFEELFKELPISLFKACGLNYFKPFFTDIKRFVMTYANTQPTERVLELGFEVAKMNNKFISRLKGIDELPVEYLFGTCYEKWLEERETKFVEWVTTTCKIERWDPVDIQRKKYWSASCVSLFNQVDELIPFVKKCEAILTTQNTTEVLFIQFSKMCGGALRLYIENVYNFFVEDFPSEIHSELHDLYNREYYNVTTGNGGLKLNYTQKKRSIFNLLPKKSGSSNLNALVDTERFSSKSSSKGKSRSNTISDRTMEMEEIEEEPTIRVFNIVVIDKKKLVKIKKLRKPIETIPAMCTKVCSVSHLATLFGKIDDSVFKKATESVFDLLGKVFRIFIHMMVYSMNLYIDAEIEYIYVKTKKKITNNALQSIQNLTTYISKTLTTLKEYFEESLFKKTSMRVLKVIEEDILSLIDPQEEEGIPPTLYQVCVLEDLLDSLKAVFINFSMKSSHLQTKIDKIMQIAKRLVNDTELEKRRVQYSEFKEKSSKKKK